MIIKGDVGAKGSLAREKGDGNWRKYIKIILDVFSFFLTMWLIEYLASSGVALSIQICEIERLLRFGSRSNTVTQSLVAEVYIVIPSNIVFYIAFKQFDMHPLIPHF